MDQTAPLFPAGHTFPYLRKCPVNREHLARRQAVFDLVIKALRKQGAPAAMPGGSCMYLHEVTGNRCGIGHLIAPVYDPVLEGMSWDTVGDYSGIANKHMAIAAQRAVEHIDHTYGLDSGGVDRLFLNDLQGVHDGVDQRLRMEHMASSVPDTFPEALEHYASHMAVQWALTLPAQDN